MGSLYRPKYRGLGGTLNQSAVIWLKYRDALGVLRHESSESDKEQRARRLLKATRGRRGSRGSIGPTRSWTRRCCATTPSSLLRVEGKVLGKEGSR